MTNEMSLLQRISDLENKWKLLFNDHESYEPYQTAPDMWNRVQWRTEARKQEKRAQHYEAWTEKKQQTITELRGRIEWLEKRLREAHAANERQAKTIFGLL